MAKPLENVLRYIRRVATIQEYRNRPDRELLERFIRQGDEAAFAALVKRHGPMVLGVCRRVLRHAQDAEDAGQATFLVFARKAGSIRKKDSVGSWLHGVAYRAAVRLKKRIVQRQAREGPVADVPSEDSADVTWREVLIILDEELQRLPERFRAPLLLCYLEGKTRNEAARELGWSLGTVRGRLERGRERLRARLTRRGVTLPSALLATLLVENATTASAPALLVLKTLNPATILAANRVPAAGLVSAQATALMKGVLNAMWLTQLKTVGVVILTVSVVGLGVGMTAGGILSTPRSVESHSEADVVPAAVLISASQSEPFVKVAPRQAASVLKYSDGKADGKRSLGGSGEMIEFTLPSENGKVAGVRIHGSRYGLLQPPKEDFLIHFLSQDMKKTLHTQMAPYALFERGPERWVDVIFERPIELPKQFWVVLDFRAEKTKGIYVSYDTSTGGKHSRVGLPGKPANETNFGGDWMIEAVLAK